MGIKSVEDGNKALGINKPDAFSSSTSNMWAGSSARLERSTDNRKVASSNPARPTKFYPIRRQYLRLF